ncbi:MAG: hypothetical protein HY927_07865 [Elusimicrobia bacterium]|nr:hypothetical protein [Elusimicrobiota bacterium]
MSFKGEVEARCPHGCQPFETEVWSFIRGDASPELRASLLARECNLLLCPGCDKPFYAEAPYVYLEPAAEILAFVFPESCKKQAARWRKKMREDFLAMRKALGAQLPLDAEPVVFFGPEGLSELLEAEDFHREETDVMECVAKGLGLGLYRVSPSYARKERMPAVLPCAAGPRGRVTLDDIRAGLARLLEANDALGAFRDCLRKLEGKAGRLPPPAKALAEGAADAGGGTRRQGRPFPEEPDVLLSPEGGSGSPAESACEPSDRGLRTSDGEE